VREIRVVNRETGDSTDTDDHHPDRDLRQSPCATSPDALPSLCRCHASVVSPRAERAVITICTSAVNLVDVIGDGANRVNQTRV
jgi:hypothetical protein